MSFFFYWVLAWRPAPTLGLCSLVRVVVSSGLLHSVLWILVPPSLPRVLVHHPTQYLPELGVLVPIFSRNMWIDLLAKYHNPPAINVHSSITIPGWHVGTEVCPQSSHKTSSFWVTIICLWSQCLLSPAPSSFCCEHTST